MRRRNVACARCCRLFNGGRYSRAYQIRWEPTADETARGEQWGERHRGCSGAQAHRRAAWQDRGPREIAAADRPLVSKERPTV